MVYYSYVYGVLLLLLEVDCLMPGQLNDVALGWSEQGTAAMTELESISWMKDSLLLSSAGFYSTPFVLE